jgi:hypothetical protein
MQIGREHETIEVVPDTEPVSIPMAEPEPEREPVGVPG